MKYNRETYNYFIDLIECYVNDKTPAPKPELVSWKDIFELTMSHKVDEIIFKSILKMEEKPADEISGAFLTNRKNNKMANIIQEKEGEIIEKTLSDNNIDSLFLKGWVLKDLYPSSEDRQMGDIDLLVRANDIDKCIPIMKALDYDAIDVGLDASHDEYKKSPYMKVEIHRRLLPPTEENHWYTDNIWDRLVKESNHRYKMTLEDFYLYHLLHFEKHFSMGGSGIRSILDHYYILKNWVDKLDWNYIDKIIEKMNYVQFQCMSNELAAMWFGETDFLKKRIDMCAEFSNDSRLSKESIQELGDYVLDSGAFGTHDNYQKWYYEKLKRENRIKGKKSFILRRVFMERERMENIYPILKKHGYLLPLMWLHRIFYVLRHRPGKIKEEIKSIQDLEK